MYLILFVLTIVVVLTAINYGMEYFLGTLGIMTAIWVFLIYYPEKHKIKYYSLFTLLISLFLFTLLLLILFFLNRSGNNPVNNPVSR
jgi:hypothetical protein